MNTEPKKYYEVVPLSSGELPDKNKPVFVIIDNKYQQTARYNIDDKGGWYGYPNPTRFYRVTAWLRPVSLSTIIKDAASKDGEKSIDWHLGNIHRVKEIAALQSNLNDFKEECERLAKVTKFWQDEYYKINPGFVPPKLDHL